VEKALLDPFIIWKTNESTKKIKGVLINRFHICFLMLVSDTKLGQLKEEKKGKLV